jgi:NUC153 domain
MVKKEINADILQDKRFKKIYSDPRFRKLALKERKIQLDDRFKAMFTQPEFQLPVPLKVDERGVEIKSVQNPLAHVYNTENIECIDSEGNFKWEVPNSSESEEEVVMENTPDIYVEPNPPLGQETSRIAVMNCDWSIIKASDLLCIFKSIAPGVLKTSIYPSEFGKSRLDIESRSGPKLEKNENEETDELALRKYELELLKYYYAVVECDSTETATKIYDECDGLEIERTSNILDLRFIPESLQFPYPPTEVATEVPKNYKMLEFYTKSLQQSRVTLSWDETPKDRANAIRNAFNSEDIDDEEISKYVATPSPVREHEEIHYNPRAGKVSQFNLMKDKDVDIEIKFHSAFDNLGKEITDHSHDKTAWEKHLDQKAKKKKESREKRKLKSKDLEKTQGYDKKSIENLKILVDSKGDIPEFSADPDDTRFKQLYTDSSYGIDPTSNQFKVDKDGNKLLLNYQIRKRKIN